MSKSINIQENNLSLLGKFAKKSDKVTFIDGNNSIIYTRVSGREQQEKNMSLTWQKKYCEELCQRNNYNIVGYFGGTFESAKTDERKEFKRMLEFIKKGKTNISNIIVYSIDRFSRTGSTWFIDQLRGWGVRIISVTQPADSNTANGRWYQKMQLLIAELDNEQRKDKCVTGMREKLLRGEWIVKPTVGYKKILEGGKIKVVPDEKSEYIRKAFYWKLKENLPLTEILKRLGKMGMKVSRTRLSEIFRNPFYCGYITGTLIDGKVVKGLHEPIVPENVFLEVNGLLSKNHYGYKHQADNDQLPLKIFVKCGDCGSSFCGYEVKKKKLFYYKCKKAGCKCNRSVKHMHTIFTDTLRQYTVDTTLIEPLKRQLMATYSQMHEQDASNEKLLGTQLTEVDKNLQTLKERWALGKISEEVYKEFAPKYNEQKDKIEEDLEKINYTSSNLESNLQTALEIACNLLTVWNVLDYTEKQRLQYLIFPKGMYYDRKNDAVRTNEVNFIFSQIAHLTKISGGSNYEHTNNSVDMFGQVGVAGFEPATSRTPSVCANRAAPHPEQLT